MNRPVANDPETCDTETMNKSVTIDGSKVSTYDAITWASKNFGQTYRVQHEFPGRHWRFVFNDAEQAFMFALKWVH